MAQENTVSGTLPTVNNPPFWYGSFSAQWTYFRVPIDILNKILASQTPSLRAYEFTDLAMDDRPMGLMNINFMAYGSDSGINSPQAYADLNKPIKFGDPMPPSLGIEMTHECEINIVASPIARAAQTPVGMTSSQFIIGRDHTKTIGNYRLWVPCDDRIAVYWGMHNFGENKVMTHPFIYDNPSLNSATSNLPGSGKWNYTIPGPIEGPATDIAFSLEIDDLKAGKTVVASNQSEIIDYSLYPHEAAPHVERRLVGSRRNAFGQFKCMTHESEPAGLPAANLKLGNSSHPMVASLKEMLGGSESISADGIMTFSSEPVVAESSLYYADV